jgi:hypothetical protein
VPGRIEDIDEQTARLAAYLVSTTRPPNSAFALLLMDIAPSKLVFTAVDTGLAKSISSVLANKGSYGTVSGGGNDADLFLCLR